MWFSFNVNVFQTVLVMWLTPLKLNHDKKKIALKGRPFTDSGPGSVVGIATGYGLDGPGIESR